MRVGCTMILMLADATYEQLGKTKEVRTSRLRSSLSAAESILVVRE